MLCIPKYIGCCLACNTFTHTSKEAFVEGKGYCLIFEGRVMPGFDRRDVIWQVAGRLGRSPESIRRLFREKPVTVRKGMDREKAFGQQRIFAKMGVSCRVEPPEDPQSHAPAADAATRHDQCPKCGNDLTKFVTPLDDCPYCGIIISKYLKLCRQKNRRP